METRLLEEVFSASEGRIVGRIRLQKIFYLLEQLGLGSGLKFSYHHYGPYSEELSQSLLLANIVDGIITEEVAENNFGATYSIYRLASQQSIRVDHVGGISFEAARAALSSMKRPTSVVIELAATIHWLKNREKTTDWLTELRNRKPGKSTEANIDQAVKLLAELGLD